MGPYRSSFLLIVLSNDFKLTLISGWSFFFLEWSIRPAHIALTALHLWSVYLKNPWPMDCPEGAMRWPGIKFLASERATSGQHVFAQGPTATLTCVHKCPPINDQTLICQGRSSLHGLTRAWNLHAGIASLAI